MLTKSRRLNSLLSIAFIAAFGACGDLGGGCGCTAEPLPNGQLPADQTVESGGQIRVSQTGFDKLTSILPGFLADTLGEGFCIGPTTVGTPDDFPFTGADFCYENDPAVPQIPDVCGSDPGCNIGFHIDVVDPNVTNDRLLNFVLQFDVHTRVPVDGAVLGIPWGCDEMHVDGDNILINIDIRFGIDPTTGELTLNLDDIRDFDSTDLDASNCGLISGAINVLNDILNSFVGDILLDVLEGPIDDLVQGLLPDPLGIEGMLDVGTLLGGVSPGTNGFMEAKLVPGGDVQLENNGLSLGLITGFNADEDPLTRSLDLDSEPAFCVPPIPAPDFSAAPANLPRVARGAGGTGDDPYQLQLAGAFLGGPPDIADDIAVGLSETTLDLVGHHIVTSGGMCLGVGTSLIAQLNLGTFSLLVPSLASLGDAANPILLVTRPQKALDFKIGTGTTADPALTIGIDDFEVDVYVFVYERYTRAFTMKLDMNVGVNLTFEQMPGEPATVTPELVGLDADNVEVTVLNNEFVAESAADLESVLPTIFDLAVGLLGDGLDAIELPDFAGFTLNAPRVQKVTTSQDDFLAIYASLSASQALQNLAGHYPSMQPALARIDAMAPLHGEPQARPVVRVLNVDSPLPQEVRNALIGERGGRMPSVRLDVPTHNIDGDPLEYAWNLGGIWRPYQPGGTIVIADRAFAWQGKYTISVRSRVVGDIFTTSEVTEVPVIIDSVGPEILWENLRYDSDGLLVPARDLVSEPTALRWAWGRPGEDEPATDWSTSATIDRATLATLASDGKVTVFVKDEVGNTSLTIVEFHGQAGEGGCDCGNSAASSPSTGGIFLVLMTFGLVYRRRLRSLLRGKFRPTPAFRSLRVVKALGLWVALCSISAFTPACNCGGDPGAQACEVTEDCTEACPEGQIPFCLDGFCVCTPDVPYGRIGPYSDVATDSGGNAWISAYAESHGDLVVGTYDTSGRVPNEVWEWVDGVPDGPVAVPDSDIRGGILAPGEDVGQWTSIAVAPDGTPMVSYFDFEHGGLKFAARVGDDWDIHTVDDGTGEIDPELGGEVTGMFSSMTVRTDDGRPGIAYLAMVSDGAGIQRAEVRFAAAQTATPQSSADWVFFTVDMQALPPLDPNMPDPTPLPGGLGLFLDATRDAEQAPILAYYDRMNGDLKLARFNVTSGVFDVSVLDGDDGTDVGWYPSIAVDAAGVVYVSYLSATRDDLLFVDTMTNTPAVVDDGYRIVGTTEDGLPKPEYHFVGDDSNVILTPTGPVVIYQDATTHELLYSGRRPNGTWVRQTLAGDEQDFEGAYGFYASATPAADDVVISTWVIDLPHGDNWVELFRERIIIE